MSSEHELELYRQLRTGQDKYVYFILAAVGACLAFSLNQTKNAELSFYQIPLGLAVSSWGLSFLFGCLKLKYTNATLYANITMLKIKSGSHPEVGSNSKLMEAALSGINQALTFNVNRANLYGKLQFSFFTLGVVFYILWHVIEMWLRSNI